MKLPSIRVTKNYSHRLCEICGQDYQPTSPIQKTCSTACSKILKSQRFKAWYQANAESCRAYSREWNAANKERKRAHGKIYYKRNRKKIIAKRKAAQAAAQSAQTAAQGKK